MGELLNESFFIALSFEVGREDGLCVPVVLALGASLATYRVTLQELVRPKQKGRRYHQMLHITEIYLVKKIYLELII